MTNEEITKMIAKLEVKVERNANLEERLEKCWRNTEKFRGKMLDMGFSYHMIEEFNKAVQPIQQYVNTIRNERKKLEKIKEAYIAKEAAEKAKKEERARALINGLYMPPVFPYNTKCNSFSFVDGEALCEIKMDLQYCNDNCPYCTNRTGSYKTDKKGFVIGIRKRGI